MLTAPTQRARMDLDKKSDPNEKCAIVMTITLSFYGFKMILESPNHFVQIPNAVML